LKLSVWSKSLARRYRFMNCSMLALSANGMPRESDSLEANDRDGVAIKSRF
jgi:hypothetical protein